MRVMWVCNGPVSMVSNVLNSNKEEGPSWIEGLLSIFNEKKEIELAYCFPQSIKEELIKTKVNGIWFYGFYKVNKQPHLYSDKVENTFKDVINEYKPEILHIFGTEYSHALSAIKAFGKPEKTIISIQGLCHIIARHYYSDLPRQIVCRYTFRDLLRNDSIKKQAKKFIKRGVNEIESIHNSLHIVGRTDFDKACCLSINPKAEYHFCNEVLRDSFYKNKWEINKCEKYSIFFSQYYYPIKGFHFMLEALGMIKKTYPDAHLYAAGMDITKMGSLKEKLRISSYGKYIRTLIRKYGLEENITFLGQLNEYEMCTRFLKSNVFVSASSIENSPNSVGEAMMLGVPTVCSDVGGVKNLITHNEDGFVYQWNAPYMLAHYIERLFEEDGLALKFSENSHYHAQSIYNREVNLNNIENIYRNINT